MPRPRLRCGRGVPIHPGMTTRRRLDAPETGVGSLVLDILWGRPPELDTLAGLSTVEWETLTATLQTHRVAPLFRWRVRGTPARDVLPPWVDEVLEMALRKATLRALVMQRELIAVHRLFDAAGIPHVALKGASLSLHAYPHPALRPLRDLDLLVAPDQVIRAFELCREAGYRDAQPSRGDLSAVLRAGNHLPRIWSPTHDVPLELHRYLSDPSAARDGYGVLGDHPGFWSRARPREVGGCSVAMPSDTDMLLHLLVHGVYMHRFDNGPIFLADLQFLLRQGDVDWPLLWDLARWGGWSRGCALGLELARQYDESVEVHWAAGQRPVVPEAMTRTARDLTLSTPDHRRDRNLRNELVRKGIGGKARLLLSKAFPPRDQLAGAYPVSQRSPLVFAYYPVHWSRLLFQRVPSAVRMFRRERVLPEADAVYRLTSWLDEAPAEGSLPAPST